MIKFKHPLKIRAGDDSVFLGIELKDIKCKTRLTFHWGDDSVKVLGAPMIAPNIFEFDPIKEGGWFLKYAVSQDAKPSCKRLYITVEQIKSRAIFIWFARIIAILALLLPIGLLLLQTLNRDFYSKSRLGLTFGSFTFSFPVMFIIATLLWSKRVTEYINRLFSITQRAFGTKLIEYEGKGMSDRAIEIVEQSSVINGEEDSLSSWIQIKTLWSESEIRNHVEQGH